MTDSATTDTDERWFADVVERLFVEFEDRHTVPAILDVVKQCRAQLDVSRGPALPELVERLARQRLTTRP